MPKIYGQRSKLNWRHRRRFHIDGLLLSFLIAGGLLIVASANFGLQRDDQQWLDVDLDPEVLADYSESPANTLLVAKVDPEIVDAIKADIKVEESIQAPQPAVVVPQSTPELTIDLPTTDTLAIANLDIIPNLSALTVSAGGPYAGEEGSTVALAIGNLGSRVSSALGTVSYRWDLDNDGRFDDALGLSASVIFNDEGEYPVSVQATDLLGRLAVDRAVVKVENLPPVVLLSPVMYTNEAEKFTVAASASDPGQDILLYEWDFGDGSNKVHGTMRPVHSYDDDGDYTVRLKVKDNDGGVTEDFMIVRVGNLAPKVDAGLNRFVSEGDPVTFRGTATDPSDFDRLTYAWDFNYDGRNFFADASGRTVTHSYQDGPASIVAALRVRDEDGGETIDTVTVGVNNVPPTIIGVTTSGPTGEGLPITLAVEATDPGNDTLAYAFDWTNDGSYEVIEQSATLSNTWYSDGDFTVGIRVYDEDNGEVFTTTVVSTFNLTPTAVAAVADTTFLEGARVPFDATQSSDPGSDDPLSFLWDFGDGSDVQSLDNSNGYAYADNGVYTATLTVVDDDGATNSDTISVNVLNANPTANAGPDLEVAEGVDVLLTFGGSASDPGSDELTFVWDLDYDGTSFDEEAFGPTPTKLYPLLDGPGQYMVALRVRDDDYPYATEAGGQIGENVDTLNVVIQNTPPRNVQANGPYLSKPGQPVQLVASEAEDVSGDTLSYEWDLDYDSSTFDADAIGRTVEHTWNTAGLYEVRLRVRDEDGGESFDTALVNVNLPPIALAGGPYSGREGSAVTFNGSRSSDPDGDSLSYLWNFGDGSPSTSGITVTHAYPDNGVYTATLTVVDQDDAAASAAASVTVVNANPVANAGPDSAANEGSALNLAASSTTDPGSGDTLTYAWDFDYDGVTFNEDASGVVVNVTYPDGPLTRTVALRVRDDDYPYTVSGGEPGEDIDVLTVAVNNLAPVAEAGGPYLSQNGEPVSLTGTGLDVPADTLAYEWDLNYDGITFTADANGQTVSHTWPTYGVYQVALRVTDKDGGTGFNLAQVDVNSSPVAGAGGPYSGDEGGQITLTGSGLDADGDALSFAWDLDNDGQFETPGRVVTHVWPDDGLYPVLIRVDDGRGGTATAQATVSISNVSPSADAGPDQTLFEGAVVSLAGAAADPGADELTYEWDFNYDGITFNVDNVGQSATTSYPNGPAAVTVALRVTDDDGGSALDTLLVTVDNAPPTADAGGPYVATAGVTITLSGTGTDVPDDTLTFVWDLDNDGSFESQGQDVSFINTTPGSYAVVLQVADNEGGIATDTTTVQVTQVTE